MNSTILMTIVAIFGPHGPKIIIGNKKRGKEKVRSYRPSRASVLRISRIIREMNHNNVSVMPYVDSYDESTYGWTAVIWNRNGDPMAG